MCTVGTITTTFASPTMSRTIALGAPVQPSTPTAVSDATAAEPAPIENATLFDQLPKSSRDQLADATLELYDKLSIKLHRREVSPLDMIPCSMAIARMSSLLCMIAQNSGSEITDEMREEHLRDAKRKWSESQVLGEPKRPSTGNKTSSLAAKMHAFKHGNVDKAGPYKIDCRCAMALWFRTVGEEIDKTFPQNQKTETMSQDLQNAIISQFSLEVDMANAVLDVWMAKPQEREKKERRDNSSTNFWKKSLPVRTGKNFVKEVMEKSKRWRMPGKFLD